MHIDGVSIRMMTSMHISTDIMHMHVESLSWRCHMGVCGAHALVSPRMRTNWPDCCDLCPCRTLGGLQSDQNEHLVVMAGMCVHFGLAEMFA
jgi:hypothetical protein